MSYFLMLYSTKILLLPNSPVINLLKKLQKTPKLSLSHKYLQPFLLLPNNCNLGQHYHATRTNNCTLQNNSCIYVVALSAVLIKTNRSGLDPYYHTFLLISNWRVQFVQTHADEEPISPRGHHSMFSY